MPKTRLFTHSRLIVVALLSFTLGIQAQSYSTKAFVTTIKSLQVYPVGARAELPYIELGTGETIRINFDEMSHNNKFYNYRIVHCDADWQRSSLSEVEYLSGFSSGDFDDYELSYNTTALYTNYQLTLPNNDIQFKVSGNYAVLVAENNDFDHLVAVACFSVAEPRIAIDAKITGNADNELNGRYQQLDFTINHQGYEIRDPFSELKVNVYQNRRTDNAAYGVKPTYTSSNKQTYQNNRSLIFEGGNQYRTIDFSSEYTYGSGIESINYKFGEFQVELMSDDVRAGKGVAMGPDSDGRYIVNRQRSDDSDLEADYMWVHFLLPMDSPYFDGRLYLLGELGNNTYDSASELVYDHQQKAYVKSLYLKQGGYSYLYAFLPKGSNKGSLERVEGSYWQTQNEYAIYVYHRSWGERYDKLIGVKLIR